MRCSMGQEVSLVTSYLRLISHALIEFLECRTRRSPAASTDADFGRSFAITLDAIYGEPDDGEMDVAAFNSLFKSTQQPAER